MKSILFLFLCVFGITLISKHPPSSAQDSKKVPSSLTDSVKSKIANLAKKDINLDSLYHITEGHIFEIKKTVKEHKILEEKVRNLESINQELIEFIDTNIINKTK